MTVAAGLAALVAILLNLPDRRARSRPMLFLQSGHAETDSARNQAANLLTNAGFGAAVGVELVYAVEEAEFALRRQVTDEDHPDYVTMGHFELTPLRTDFVGTGTNTGALLSPRFAGDAWHGLQHFLSEESTHGREYLSDLLQEAEDPDPFDNWFYFRATIAVRITYRDAAGAGPYSTQGRVRVVGTVRERYATANPIPAHSEPPTSRFVGEVTVLRQALPHVPPTGRPG